MVKSFIYISMVASFAIFSTGCGSSNSTTKTEIKDTTAPVITTATPIEVQEDTNNTTTLAANEAATYSIPVTDHFSLTGSTLTFSAPNFDANGGNEFNITVTATDTSGNAGNKVLVFDVVQTQAQATVASTGDKNLSIDGTDVIGPSGLKWLNEAPANVVNFDDAQSYCTGKEYRLASRDELLNLIDYSKGDHGNASLLEDELNAFTGLSESWASKIGDKFLSVNFSDGADAITNDGAVTRSVVCVKGAGVPAHTFVAEGNVTTDQTTQLQWTSIGDPTDGNVRKAIENDEAANYCTGLATDGGNWRLPNINELRTLMQTEDHKVPVSIAPDGTTVMWSSTEFTNAAANNPQNYVLDVVGDIATIRSEEISSQNQAVKLFVTCVKNR